jgi:hypothetical protein
VNSTPERFEAILDQCLSQIMAGKARVTSALVAYPALAGDLEPLLLTAEWVRGLPVEDLSPEASARIERLLLKRTGRKLQIRLPAWQRPVFRPAWSWAAARVVLALLVVLLLGGMVVASARALPGEPWYRARLAAEEAWLWLVPPQSKPGLHVSYARRRLDELQALLDRGQFDPTVVEAAGRHLAAALDGTEDLPPATALAILDEVLTLNDREDRLLAQVPASQPGLSPGWLVAMRQGAATRTQRAQVLMALLGGGRTPLPPTAGTFLAGTVTPTPQRQTGTPPPTGRTGSPSPAGATREPTAASGTPEPASPTGSPEPALTTGTPEPAGATDTPERDRDADTDTPVPAPPADTPVIVVPTSPPQPPAATSTPLPPAPTDTPPPPAPTDTSPPPAPTDTSPPPAPTDTPQPPAPTDTPEPVPPGHTKTPEPPGQTKTPQPPGQTNTPPSGRVP